MKRILPLLWLFAAPTAFADIPLTFRITAAPAAVALQFDVTANGASFTLGSPTYAGVSPHAVDSNVVSGGATRFVLYSTDNAPISANGEITVRLVASGVPQNGMLTVGGVLASNATGQQVSASLNTLPARKSADLTRQLVKTGTQTTLASDVFDADGSISSVTFRVNGSAVGTASGTNQTLAHTPSISGLFPLAVEATDSSAAKSTLSLGELLAYRISEITTYQAFRDVHYAGSQDPAIAGFGADPFATGVPNGVAFVLGLDPRAPDQSLLPSSTIEPRSGGGHELVFRFARPTGISALSWAITESSSLSGWTVLPGAQIVQTARGDGFTDVTARRVVPTVPNGRIFMVLEAKE